jgi:hypothetical protein
MHVLLYNSYENPKGQSIYSLCKEIQCKDKLKEIAKGVLEFMKIIYKPDINLLFGNINRN